MHQTSMVLTISTLRRVVLVVFFLFWFWFLRFGRRLDNGDCIFPLGPLAEIDELASL